MNGTCEEPSLPRVMDYCHPCGRHLNGALACPGCGAPVEPPADSTQAHAPAVDARPDTGGASYEGTPDAGREKGDADDEPQGRAARRKNRGRVRVESTLAATEAEADDDGPEDPDTAGGSRRDRKAAAHRRRRRRVLLITAGFVLAAAGLSLAELGTDAPFSIPGSAAPGASAEGGADEEASPTAEPLDATKTVGTGAGTASPDASASPSASPSKSPKATKDPEETGTPTAATGDDTTSPASTSSTNPPTTTPSSEPTSSDPSPTPSPSETCKQILWWCS